MGELQLQVLVIKVLHRLIYADPDGRVAIAIGVGVAVGAAVLALTSLVIIHEIVQECKEVRKTCWWKNTYIKHDRIVCLYHCDWTGKDIEYFPEEGEDCPSIIAQPE